LDLAAVAPALAWLFTSGIGVIASILTAYRYLSWTSISLRPVIYLQGLNSRTIHILKPEVQIPELFNEYDQTEKTPYAPWGIYLGIEIRLIRHGQRMAHVKDIYLKRVSGKLFDSYSSHNSKVLEIKDGTDFVYTFWLDRLPEFASNPESLFGEGLYAEVTHRTGYKVLARRFISKRTLRRLVENFREQQKLYGFKN
jgi:hypothetical protein